jgi:hypothetical protein
MRRGLRALIVCIAGIAALVALASPASAMVPNFYAHLDLTNGGHTVVAGGPCQWQPGDAWAEIQDVTITQGSVTGTSSGSTTVRKGQDAAWWLDASSSGQFTPGPAEAYAQCRWVRLLAVW